MDFIQIIMDGLRDRYAGFWDRFAVWDYLIILGQVGSVFMVLMLIELVYDSIKQKAKGIWDSLANLSFVIVSYWTEETMYGLFFILILLLFEPLALFQIPITPWTWVACLFAADFIYYWMHRSEHMVRLFWTHHSVHHSSQDYNLTTAVRLFWFLDVFMWVFFLPMVILGFDTAQILICVVSIFTYMFWIHTQKVGKMKWLELFMNTPSFHRVHHGRNAIYIDKNFAGMFTIWDRMFGTYQPETVPVDFGITKPINTTNPIKVGLIGFIRLFQDLAAADSWKTRFLYLVKRPGWQPAEKTDV